MLGRRSLALLRTRAAALGLGDDIVLDVLPARIESQSLDRPLSQVLGNGVEPASLQNPSVVLLELALADPGGRRIELEGSRPLSTTLGFWRDAGSTPFPSTWDRG